MRVKHLSDDRLVELCMLDALSAAEQQHLSTCERCDARPPAAAAHARRRLEVADAAADAAFPA
jgi:hypothetical protein